MSSLLSPVASNTSWKVGTSISTPLVVAGECRSLGACAKPITATSVTISDSLLQMMGVGLIGSVGFTGRLEMIDVPHRGLPLLARLPHGLDPHAHPDFLRSAAEDQMLEGDIGPVDQHRGGHVGHLHLLTVERHVHHAERGHDAGVWELNLGFGGHSVHRAGPAR